LETFLINFEPLWKNDKSFLGIFKKFCFSNSLQRRGKITIMEEDDYHVPQNAGPVGFRSVGIVRAIATEAGSSVS
jgi:hypothetical protein